MKAFIFIPDTHEKVGLGHLNRCLKYSAFISKKFKIFFFIKYNIKKSYLKKSLNGRKINYIFYKNLKKKILFFKNKNYKKVFLLIDSYNKKNHNNNFNNIYCKKISIVDFKIPNNSDILLDHTFLRKSEFHKLKKNQKIFIGQKYFPIFKCNKKNGKKYILVNFGSIKNISLFKKSIFFLKRLNLNPKIKLIIINNYLKKKDIKSFKKIYSIRNIVHYKYMNNLNPIYENTLFALGGCGLSLYERSFYNIPSIVKSVAKNQDYNFKNFLYKKCILDYNKIINLNLSSLKVKNKFYKDLSIIRKKLKKIFVEKENKKKISNLFNKINEI